MGGTPGSPSLATDNRLKYGEQFQLRECRKQYCQSHSYYRVNVCLSLKSKLWHVVNEELRQCIQRVTVVCLQIYMFSFNQLLLEVQSVQLCH